MGFIEETHSAHIEFARAFPVEKRAIFGSVAARLGSLHPLQHILDRTPPLPDSEIHAGAVSWRVLFAMPRKGCAP
jgi:hypothetical protein